MRKCTVFRRGSTSLRSGRKLRLLSSDKRKLVRMFRKNSGTTEAQASHQLESVVTPASLSIVKQVLRRYVMTRCRPRKKPLLQNGHLWAWLNFPHVDKPNTFWKNVLWSDETNTELFDHSDKRYVWRNNGRAIKSKNRVPAVKYGGGRFIYQFWREEWSRIMAEACWSLPKASGEDATY